MTEEGKIILGVWNAEHLQENPCRCCNTVRCSAKTAKCEEYLHWLDQVKMYTLSCCYISYPPSQPTSSLSNDARDKFVFVFRRWADAAGILTRTDYKLSYVEIPVFADNALAVQAFLGVTRPQDSSFADIKVLLNERFDTLGVMHCWDGLKCRLNVPDNEAGLSLWEHLIGKRLAD